VLAAYWLPDNIPDDQLLAKVLKINSVARAGLTGNCLASVGVHPSQESRAIRRVATA